MSIVSKKLKVIFFHIEKCGGTTIKQLLRRVDKNIEFKKFVSFFDALFIFKDIRMERASTIHMSVEKQKKIIPKSFWETYYKFAFIRNPWDRVLSHYFFLKEYGRINCATFEEYIKTTDLRKQLSSQFEYLSENRKINLNFIGAFENFEEDLKKVLDNFKIDVKRIPKVNISIHSDYTKYYTEELKNIVADIYKNDIDCFGYSFGGGYPTKIVNNNLLDDDKFVLVACARNEGPYLLEWICYHKLLGFDDIYICSHDNQDCSEKLLEKLNEIGLIKYIDFTGKIPMGEKVQKYMYQDALKKIKEINAKWICAIDIDEFIVLNKHKNIKEFVDSYGDKYDGIVFNWRMFNSNGKFKKQNGLVTENYTVLGNENHISIKTIARKISIKNWASPHRPAYFEKNKKVIYPDYYNYKFPENLEERKKNAYFNSDIAIINHYVVKSYEEFLMKIVRGTGMEIGSQINDENLKEKEGLFNAQNTVKKIEFDYSIKDTEAHKKLKTYMQEITEKNNLKEILDCINTKFESEIKRHISALSEEKIKKVKNKLNYK